MSSTNTTMGCLGQTSFAGTSLQLEELEKRDHLHAVEILTKEIKLDPENYFFYYERSICHYKLGDFKASLDDANTALRLNRSDHQIHKLKGLALVGLSRRAEAVTSFKKSIALLAMKEESKLSEIFNLLKFASSELRAGKPLETSVTQPTACGPSKNEEDKQGVNNQGTSGNNSVDSTTDKPSNHPAVSSADPKGSVASIASIMKTGSNSLVATNCNSTSNLNNNRPIVNGTNNVGICNNNLYINNVASDASNMSTNRSAINGRVTSSAGSIGEHHVVPSMNLNLGINGINQNVTNMGHDLLRIQQQTNPSASESAMLEWNIRRSERIFLHHTGDLTPPANQYGLLKNNDHPGLILSPKTMTSPNAVTNNRITPKRPRDESGVPLSQASGKMDDSHVEESDVDVDDSCNDSNKPISTDKSDDHNQLTIAPSSSLTATLQQRPTTSREDSYSSRYKRLRRDRERARRGTSKLCTIKITDLEELQKPITSGKRSMRVIAPINGWLYSGELSVIERSNPIQYVVDLDEAVNGSSSYLFNQLTVLTEVIKDVRIKSVADLRKGARICCYWKRQKKCLSTGVVTSRTFEATKALVSVKYDNGDLSALPLDDLRLLPPDYPKYMSNPELLDRDSGSVAGVVSVSSPYPTIVYDNSNKITLERKISNSDPTKKVELPSVGPQDNLITTELPTSQPAISKESNNHQEREQATVLVAAKTLEDQPTNHQDNFAKDNQDNNRFEEPKRQSPDHQQTSTIPPTDEVIDFITSENNYRPTSVHNEQPKPQHILTDEELRSPSVELAERVDLIANELTIASPSNEDTHMMSGSDGFSVVENNSTFGIEYRPWVFDGPPKRTKRHGRTYRDTYSRIRRGNEILRVGDSAELMPRDESLPPYIAKIESFWATSRGEMIVKVRWYYRLDETKGEPYKLRDGENALFETDHPDENDVQSIIGATEILSWTDYSKLHLSHVNASQDKAPKIFYLAGYYDPCGEVKHLKADVREANLANV